jgi:hypothetical protein
LIERRQALKKRENTENESEKRGLTIDRGEVAAVTNVTTIENLVYFMTLFDKVFIGNLSLLHIHRLNSQFIACDSLK